MDEGQLVPHSYIYVYIHTLYIHTIYIYINYIYRLYIERDYIYSIDSSYI